MKKRLLALALVLGMMVIPAAAADGGGIEFPSRVRDGETLLWGLADPEDYHVILPAEYNYISSFSDDGYAVVRKERYPEGEDWYYEYGLVDWKGNFVLPLGEYNYIDMGTDGIALVRNKEEMSAYLRVSDRTPITDFCFRDLDPFYMLGIGRMMVNGEERYGAVNAQGETVIPFEYDQLDSPRPYSYYKFIPASKDGHQGAFNYDGSLLRRCIYPNYPAMARSLALPAQMTEEEEMAALIAACQTWEPLQDENGLWGYHIPQGDAAEDPGWAIPPHYAAAQPFDQSGRAQVTKRDGRSGCIDQSGDFSSTEVPFTDVPAGSWYEEGVKTCAENGIMVGTAEGVFSPDTPLTDAECLTLALRLYDLQRGGDGTFPTAPEGAGYMTLTLADGTVFEGYGTASSPFYMWSWRNGNWGVCVKPKGDTPEEQEAWGTAHEGAAVFTIEGVSYPGTVDCWIPTGGWALMFQPDSAENAGESVFHSAVLSGIPAPGVWWRDAVYAAHQWGLDDRQTTPGVSDLANWYLEEGRHTTRETFAKALFDAAGELEKLYTVDWLPDLDRSEFNESIFKLYEAGILSGVDAVGTFAPYGSLTRAECATMVARVLDPSLRLKEPPRSVSAYEQAVLRLRSNYDDTIERSFDSPTATVFLHDGWSVLTLIGKAGFEKGEGTVIDLPCPPYMGYGTPLTAPDTTVLSEDGKTLTYTYTFAEPYIENGLPVRPAGTYTYIVDMATGEVTENAPTLPETGYDKAVEELRSVAGYIADYEETYEFDECTVFIYDIENGADIRWGAMRAIFKPGSALGDGTAIDLPYVSTTALPVPAERYYRGDQGMAILGGILVDNQLPDDGNGASRFIWSYFFDTPAYDYSDKDGAAAIDPGLTVFALDVTTGKISKSFRPMNYADAREHVFRERAVEGGRLIRDRYNNGSYETESPFCSVMRVEGIVAGTGEDERNPWDGVEDHAYYLVYKPGSAFPEGTIKRLPLPSTQIIPGVEDYFPSSRIALEESMSPDGKTFTYVYRFTHPLAYTGGSGQEVALHDAGTYTYTVDLATGEVSVKHESLDTGYTVEKELDNDLANVRLVYTQPHGVKDYQLLVTEKSTGLLYHAILPTTQVITLPDGSLYTPTTVAPNTILWDAFDETSGRVRYIYRFDEPLTENGIAYHDAGIYNYFLTPGSSGSFNYGSLQSERAYAEGLANQLKYADEVNLQWECRQCTFLLYTSSGSRGGTYARLVLIFKPDSALGEGIVEKYPCIRHQGVTYIPTVTVDEKAMTLTYTYHFDQPLVNHYTYSGGETEDEVAYEAGTHRYTVDLTTGEVAYVHTAE